MKIFFLCTQICVLGECGKSHRGCHHWRSNGWHWTRQTRSLRCKPLLLLTPAHRSSVSVTIYRSCSFFVFRSSFLECTTANLQWRARCISVWLRERREKREKGEKGNKVHFLRQVWSRLIPFIPLLARSLHLMWEWGPQVGAIATLLVTREVSSRATKALAETQEQPPWLLFFLLFSVRVTDDSMTLYIRDNMC